MVRYQIDGTLSISIIIPFLNEENSIRNCLEIVYQHCLEQKWDFELICVEDGSTDKSTTIVNEMCLLDSRIKLISLPNHAGKGGSIKFAALHAATKKYIAYMDADLSAGPAELGRLIQHIKNNDAVIGSRFLREGLPHVKRKLHRIVPSRIYAMLFRKLFRISVYDPQCGLKLFKRSALDVFRYITVEGFAFDTDFIVTAFALGLQVKEVPIIWKEGSSSKINVLQEIKIMGKDILSVWYKYHLSWIRGQLVYPQKKGSVYGQMLFKLLSSLRRPIVENDFRRFSTYEDAIRLIQEA